MGFATHFTKSHFISLKFILCATYEVNLEAYKIYIIHLKYLRSSSEKKNQVGTKFSKG